MAGPPRRLLIDISGFEAHVSRLASLHPAAIFDLRADAYGLGLSNVRSIFDRLGLGVLSDGDHDLEQAVVSALGDHVGPEPAVIPGEMVLGLHNDGPGFARLSGTVVKVKQVPAGRRISYGYTYATSHESTVALVALGYADGIVRRASNRAPVRVNTQTGIIAGRIAMDQFVVDLGNAQIAPGDEAVLFGNPEHQEPSIATWSALTGVPALAIMSGLGNRVTRVIASPVGTSQ